MQARLKVRAQITIALVSGDVITLTHANLAGRVAIAVEVAGFAGSPADIAGFGNFDQTGASATSATVTGAGSTTKTNVRVFAVWSLDNLASAPVAGSGYAIEAQQASSNQTAVLAAYGIASVGEGAQFGDSGTPRVTITNSGTEALFSAIFDADTARVKFTVSAVDVADLADSGAPRVTITPSSTDVPERAFLDSGTITVGIAPATTFEDIVKSDSLTISLTITPFALSEFQGDGDIVPVRITSTLIEAYAYADTKIVLLSIIPDATETGGLTTPGTILFHITPSVAEVLATIDAATILVSIKPGVVFEVRRVADYLLVGVVSSKWTAILRDNAYSGKLHETRYVVVSFDNRWHYHYRGRGDE